MIANPSAHSIRLGVVCAALTSVAVIVSASPAQARAARDWDDQGLVAGYKGVDVSLWNHGYTPPLDFTKLKAAGVNFVMIKASDGSPKGEIGAKKYWPIDRKAAHAAGLVVGSYHYAQPTSKIADLRKDARAEARRAALRTMKWRRGYLPTALDLEEAPANLNPANLTIWARTWLTTYERVTGRTPFLYSYRSFIATRLLPTKRLTHFPIWFAQWGRGRTVPEPIQGWPTDTVRMWQFTSQGRITGSGSRLIDMNVYLGSAAQFRKQAALSKKAAGAYGL